MATQFYKVTENHWTVHLQWMNCMVYKLYFHKVVKNHILENDGWRPGSLGSL